MSACTQHPSSQPAHQRRARSEPGPAGSSDGNEDRLACKICTSVASCPQHLASVLSTQPVPQASRQEFVADHAQNIKCVGNPK